MSVVFFHVQKWRWHQMNTSRASRPLLHRYALEAHGFGFPPFSESPSYQRLGVLGKGICPKSFRYGRWRPLDISRWVQNAATGCGIIVPTSEAPFWENIICCFVPPSSVHYLFLYIYIYIYIIHGLRGILLEQRILQTLEKLQQTRSKISTTQQIIKSPE